MNKLKIFIFLFFVYGCGLVSAIVVNSVSVGDVSPGEEETIRIEIKNILQDDAKDISFRLLFVDSPFTPVGNSEFGEDEIKEGDEEDFIFRIKASNDISPGDYKIPYILTFKERGQSNEKKREGEVGVRVIADSDLSYSLNTETPVINREGKIILKIVNRGFGDAKFLSVKIFPEGYTLLSENEVYVGSVDSDDFETVSFDVIFNSERANVNALIGYKDFDNKKIVKNINLPLRVYSQKKAIKLGVIKKNKLGSYVSSGIVVILFWFGWRTIRRRKLKKRTTK